ncbi:hypothetical protein [Parvibaculum sp.]|uniref:hypothetical protein n=1 Tax=Parvibaculum sp. TaxID=2024848 RepID=UPI003C794694
MRGNMRLAMAAAVVALGLSALGGCVSPARTPSDAYAPNPDQASVTTTTTTTVYSDDAYRGQPNSQGGSIYDDPHHYERGPNQHKY